MKTWEQYEAASEIVGKSLLLFACWFYIITSMLTHPITDNRRSNHNDGSTRRRSAKNFT